MDPGGEPRAKGSNKFAIFDLKKDTSEPRNIFEAAERGDVAYINNIIDKSIEFDANQMDVNQRTALHWAAEMGRVEVAELLIETGANVAAAECNGRTAIHLASRSGDVEMLRLLIAAVPDAAEKAKLSNQVDTFGITPVFLAVQKGDQGAAAFDFLISIGGKYNEEDTHNSKLLA